MRDDVNQMRRNPSNPEEWQERKERVLTMGAPSVVRSIADAVVIKDEELYFLAQPDGDVPMDEEHGYGLYYQDCRFLSGYELRLGGSQLNSLVASDAGGFMAVFQLSNADVRTEDDALIHKEQVGIKWDRVVDADRSALDELITFQNFGREAVELPITLSFRASFDDIFLVRGLVPAEGIRRSKPRWKDGVLLFENHGRDERTRTLGVQFVPPPDEVKGSTVHFNFRLRPQEDRWIAVTLDVSESRGRSVERPKACRPSDLKNVEDILRRSIQEWRSRQTEIHSDGLLLNRVLERSLRDLRALRSRLKGHEYFAAGVPWFVTLFGRDSLLAAMQSLAYEPSIAEQTLRLLALHQGRRDDAYRDEQPGKILHEFRDGELARTGEVPHSPYYGTVDATPLFIILLERHASWTGCLRVFHDLRDNVERALDWMARRFDEAGYIAYQSTSKNGLINQGWKDSGDAIVNDDGTLAEPPVSLIEVQGYAYRAFLAAADLFDRAGDSDRAGRLRKDADDLQSRVNRDFWLEDRDFYALALQAEGRPCKVISSNPGHALWSGIAESEQARRTAERLMADDMFNGWGIRTLSHDEPGYHPLSYHRGTVWPHDNSLIVAGLRRYGFDEAACRVFTGLVEAATHVPHDRLPELFAGFGRSEYRVPVRYPVACHPQAWAAGAVPYLVTTLLGLEPDGFNRGLRVVRPILPPMIDWLEVRRLRVADARIDLRFDRGSACSATVKVLHIEGKLDVDVVS
jgi:glycogen debranching enzyme